MIARAQERELDLEMERKRKPDMVQTCSSGKKPKVSDHRSRSQQGHNRVAVQQDARGGVQGREFELLQVRPD